jgi:hypothetical protein
MNNINSYFEPTPNWTKLVNSDKPIILDIGANDGGTSFVFQKLFPKSFVYAFEPDPRALINCKQRVLVGNIDSERFELFEGAVSDKIGQSIFYQSDGVDPNFNWYPTGYDLSGSLLQPLLENLAEIPSIHFRNQIEVKTITLDSWIVAKNIQKIDILWMDVQGAEAKVLIGATETLKITEYIYLECEEQKTYSDQPTLSYIKSIIPNFELLFSYADGNHLFKRL